MKNILLTLSIVFIAGCMPSKPAKSSFDKFGVSFTCPAGWSITDEDNFDNAGYYLSCEKSGLNASGLLTISWTNDTIDLDEQIEIYKESFKIYKNANLEFMDITDEEFNGYSSRALKYKLIVLTVKQEGIIHSFYAGGKTFCILKQGALEDSEANKEGFKIIESGFFCK